MVKHRERARMAQSGFARFLLPATIPLALALSGCVGLGGANLPDELLTLTPDAVVPAGSAARGTTEDAIAILEPAASERLDVTRVPVRVSESKVAYLKDAVWVDKPARLFQRMLAETIRAKGTRLVIDGTERRFTAANRLEGQLLEMGYDVGLGAVVVRYEGVLTSGDGSIATRRFESEILGVAPDAAEVGPALNRAANDVVAQVADWVG